jgi:serine protease Do
VRPWLSFTGKPVTSEIASALGLDRPVGVLIEKVRHSGPGTRAGLVPGDVVVAVGKHDVDDVQALRFRIATKPIGESVELSVVRRGELRALPFDLVAPPEDPPRNLTLIKGRNPVAGITVGNLSPALGEEIGFDSGLNGVVVVRIEKRSTAARLGFRPHDIIRAVNGSQVKRVTDLERAAADRQKEWLLEIQRDGRSIQLQVSG